MGCCFSRTTDGAHLHVRDDVRFPVKARLPESFNTHVGNKSSNGTLVLMEEETVKEVLSETPIVKPQRLNEAVQNKIPELKFSKAEEGVLSETSQVTELCSNMSESISMATTISELREDDEASSKRSRETDRSTKPKIRRRRPQAGGVGPPSRREERDKCPIKRAEPLPEKNSRVTRRYAHGTECTEGRMRKLDTGVSQQSEVSHIRHSRLPATRTTGGTRKTSNTKRSGMTPMKVNGQTGDQQEIKTAEKRDKGKAVKPLEGAIQPTNESIENPLVSLECFIFL